MPFCQHTTASNLSVASRCLADPCLSATATTCLSHQIVCWGLADQSGYLQGSTTRDSLPTYDQDVSTHLQHNLPVRWLGRQGSRLLLRCCSSTLEFQPLLQSAYYCWSRAPPDGLFWRRHLHHLPLQDHVSGQSHHKRAVLFLLFRATPHLCDFNLKSILAARFCKSVVKEMPYDKTQICNQLQILTLLATGHDDRINSATSR